MFRFAKGRVNQVLRKLGKDSSTKDVSGWVFERTSLPRRAVPNQVEPWLVAMILRESRSLMNLEGTHWIQGDMHAIIDEETKDEIWYDTLAEAEEESGKKCGHAFCSMGGLEAYVDLLKLSAGGIVQRDGYIKFVDHSDPSEKVIKMAHQNAYFALALVVQSENDTYYEMFENWDIAESRVIDWNDTDGRTWEQVSAGFEKAARLVEDKVIPVYQGYPDRDEVMSEDLAKALGIDLSNVKGHHEDMHVF